MVEIPRKKGVWMLKKHRLKWVKLVKIGCGLSMFVIQSHVIHRIMVGALYPLFRGHRASF